MLAALYYLLAILLFSVIILFHELGHFLLAKANGICVNEFCLGLGPTIIGFQKGETKYSLKLLPFGGACMMEGEDEGSDNPRAFTNKSVWARISVVFAGPFFNFIMAFVFSFIIIASMGYLSPTITGVMEGYSAEEAGLQEGDTILKLNSHRIYFYDEVSMYSIFHAGEDVTVTFEREGKTYTTLLTPTYNEEYDRYLYGIQGPQSYTKGNLLDTTAHAFLEVRYWIDYTFSALKMLCTGGASINDLSGPVGIVQNVGNTVKESAETDGAYYVFLNLLNWGILLSANLGVMNLLPLPALDGGRLLFLIIEAIRRKPIDREKEGMVHGIGLVLLLVLMVFVMANDIRRLIF